MNNLSYIIVWFLFAGMIYVGFEIKNNIAQQEINRVQSIEDERIAKEKAIQDAIDQEIADKDKFIRIIKHDSDPSTDLFDIKLTAFSSDPENDEMSYLWEQVRVSIDYEGGPKVELIDYDKPTAYFRAPAGEYRFQLTVTDEYGDSNMDSQVIKIVPEPNEAPLVDIIVESDFVPSNSFSILHDKDPKEGIFNIKLEANGKEPDGDKYTYKWEQIAISPSLSILPIELSNNDKAVTYFKAKAGKYRIQLTMTDDYGDSDVTSQLIIIKGEPNKAPSINFNVSEGAKPIDPFEGDVKKIIEFQKENGLEADGKWGPESEKKHKELLKKNKTKIIIKDN